LKYLSKIGIKDFYVVIDIGEDTRYITENGTLSSDDIDIIHIDVLEGKISEEQAVSQVNGKLASSDQAEKQVESYVNRSKDKIVKSRITEVTKLSPNPLTDDAKKNIFQMIGNNYPVTGII
jgi:hypothetical protein